MVTRTKKIFVGGLSANTVVEDVKQYFEQFGKVRGVLFLSLHIFQPCRVTISTETRFLFDFPLCAQHLSYNVLI